MTSMIGNSSERIRRAAPGEVTIFGGQIDSPQLRRFLEPTDGWGILRADMPYLIWEEIETISFVDTQHRPWQLPPNLDVFERLRCFGPGGDLTVRRADDTLHFWFVGDTAAHPHLPGEMAFRGADFWTAAPARDTQIQEHGLMVRELSFLLWGKYRDDLSRWYDDAVGQAKLNYPFAQQAERLRVRAKEFIYAGETVFVHWYGIEAHLNDDSLN